MRKSSLESRHFSQNDQFIFKKKAKYPALKCSVSQIALFVFSTSSRDQKDKIALKQGEHLQLQLFSYATVQTSIPPVPTDVNQVAIPVPLHKVLG